MTDPSRCALCVSLAAGTPGALRLEFGSLSGADLAELRLDAIADPTTLSESALAELIAACPVPALVTCRPAWEGGGFTGPEAERRELLQRAIDAGARLVDVELAAEFHGALIDALPGRVVLSHHWTSPCLENLGAVVERMIGAQPAVAKLVAPIDEPQHALPLLQAGERLRRQGIDSACFAMGAAGRASRLLAAAGGDRLLYVAPPGLEATAPGQWDAEWLARELVFERWGRGMQVFGLLGAPLESSLSPVIFNAAFAATGCEAVYAPLPGSPFDAVLELAAGTGVQGLSVTMPYKRAALHACAEVSELGRRIGAVNTLTRLDAGWRGDNTDGPAVVEAFESVLPVGGKRAAVVGAGGAGRAAAVALADAGASVALLNRTAERARTVAAEIGCAGGGLEMLATERFDLLVNATPVGMNGAAQAAVSTADLKGDETVLDMVYRPLETPLLRQARERGCRTLSGLEMFLRQARAQFELWTGARAPAGVMGAAARARLDTERTRTEEAP